MRSVPDLIRRHPVRAYVLLAWALAWAYWIPMALAGQVVTPGGNVSHFPGLATPLAAALIVTALCTGRAGLRDFGARAVRWQVGARWYLVAAIPFLLYLVAVGLLALTGGDVPPWSDLASFSGLPPMAVPLLVLVVLAVNGFGEEGGWRGFLTPQLLLRRGPFATSMLVAAAWFTWHVPSFWVIETYRLMGWAIVPMMGIGLISGAMVLTWIYTGSGGSILIVSLWHLALNFASATTAGRGMPGTVVYMGIVVWAVLVGIGWLVAGEPRTRPFGKRLRDGFMIRILRSPLGHLFTGMTVIGFRARRSGRTLMTPVQCVRDGGHVYVLVGNPDEKQWWRNVAADPHVTIEVDGHDVAGTAVVHVGADAGAATDLAAYLGHRPAVARMLKIDPHSPQSLAAAAQRSVSVRIDLEAAPAT
jgi:membrane protease YdiL (CAAX protease family)